MKPKFFGMLATFCMLCILAAVIQPAQALQGIQVQVGQTMKYNGSASASYRMYGSSIFVNITNVDTYPVKGTLQYLSGDNPTTPEQDLIPFVVKVPTTWQAGSANSPFNSIVDANSPFITNWTSDHLVFKYDKSEVFADSGRNATILTYQYNYTIMTENNVSQNIQTDCQYKWDINNGILLSYHINITNLADFALDGFINMDLSETTVWKLDTTAQIPGFSLEILGVSSMVILFGLWFHMNKNKHYGISKGGN